MKNSPENTKIKVYGNFLRNEAETDTRANVKHVTFNWPQSMP